MLPAEEKPNSGVPAQEGPTDSPFSLARRSDFLSQFYREKNRGIIERLRPSKVPTNEKAEHIANAAKRRHGGISAMESSGVIGLVCLGRKIPGFGEAGDYVWIVRFASLGVGTTQEAWVSSTTGEVRWIFPLKPPIGGKLPE